MAQDDYNDAAAIAYAQFLERTGIHRDLKEECNTDEKRKPPTDQVTPDAETVLRESELPTDVAHEQALENTESIKHVDDGNEGSSSPSGQRDNSQAEITNTLSEDSLVSSHDEKGFVTFEKFKEHLGDELMGDYGVQEFTKPVVIRDTDGATASNSNYASLDKGATILDTSEGTKSATNLLVRDKDRYMLMPREREKKWIVISLSEDIHVEAIAISNFEKFSSRVQDFWVLGSLNYPTEKWTMLGNFTADDKYGEQMFHFKEKHHVRYLKLRFISNYGNEYYCTLSQLQVFGRTLTDFISQLQDSLSDYSHDLESVKRKMSPDIISTGNRGLHESHSTRVRVVKRFGNVSHTCPHVYARVNIPLLRDQWCINPEVISDSSKLAAGDKAIPEIMAPMDATLKEVHSRNDSTPVQDPVNRKTDDISTLPSNSSNLDVASPLPTDGNSPKDESEDALTDSADLQASVEVHVEEKISDQPTVGTAESKENSSPQKGKSASVGSVPPIQNIFVSMTNRIKLLELNQTIFNRYLSEIDTRYQAAITDLQKENSGMNEQIQVMTRHIEDLQERVNKDMVVVDYKYMHVLDETRQENLSLREELLLVRKVIVTLKAGIVVAILLSCIAIVGFIIRLVIRCIVRRRRTPGRKQKETLPDSSFDKIVLRIDRSIRFGKSLDDSSIQRCTMYSTLICTNSGFRRHHFSDKRSKQS